MKHFASQSQVKQLIKAGYNLKPYEHYCHDERITEVDVDLQDLIELAGERFIFLERSGNKWLAHDDTDVYEATNPVDAMVKLLLNNNPK